MYSQFVAVVLAALAVVPAAASPIEERNTFVPRRITQHFHFTGNNTGIKKIDGVQLGARNVVNTYTGWGLPYGQTPQTFGYDDKSAYVYAGQTANGEQMVLGAFAKNGTAAIKTAIPNEEGFNALECTVLAKTLFCNANIDGTLYHDLLAVDYKGDGNYEFAIGPTSSGETEVQLVVSNA